VMVVWIYLCDGSWVFFWNENQEYISYIFFGKLTLTPYIHMYVILPLIKFIYFVIIIFSLLNCLKYVNKNKLRCASSFYYIKKKKAPPLSFPKYYKMIFNILLIFIPKKNPTTITEVDPDYHHTTSVMVVWIYLCDGSLDLPL
jgi:hypothetical protein